jgi:hypothetical protein
MADVDCGEGDGKLFAYPHVRRVRVVSHARGVGPCGDAAQVLGRGRPETGFERESDDVRTEATVFSISNLALGEWLRFFAMLCSMLLEDLGCAALPTTKQLLNRK